MVPTVVTTSELRTFVACPQKWQFKYEKQLGREDALDGNRAAALGSQVHDALESFHHNNANDLQAALDRLPPEAEDAAKIIQTYAEWLVNNPLPGRVLSLEEPFCIQILDDPLVFLGGRMDGIIENDDGTLSVLEHKTSGDLGDNYFRRLAVDYQVRSYAYALSRDKRWAGRRVRSVVYNVLSSKPPADPEVLKSGGLSQAKGVRTTSARYEAAMRAQGIPLTDLRYAETLARIRENERDGFVRRQEYFFRPEDIEYYVGMVRGLVRSMVTSPLIYKNPSECTHFTGCAYMPLCGGTCTDDDVYVRREARHPEGVGLDYADFIKYDSGCSAPIGTGKPKLSNDELYALSQG